MFPGLIFRIIDPKVVLLIFVSGKLVLTGAKVMIFSSDFLCFSLLSKKRDDIMKAFEIIYHILVQCRQNKID